MRKSKIKKLTEEQRKFVSDNIGLVRYYCGQELRKGNIPNGYKDQFIGALEEKFCKIAVSFDKERGVKFCTYAYKCFRSAKNDFLRKIKRDKETHRIPVIPYYENYFMENTLWNSISGYGREHLDLEKIAELIDETDLTKREIICLQSYYYDDLYYRQIGEIYNVSGERIRQIIKNALIKIRLKALKSKYVEEDFYVEK